MPNWCLNRVEVSGAPEAVEKFKAAVRDGEVLFSFNKIVPMPPALDIENSSYGKVGYVALYGDYKRILEEYEWIPQEVRSRGSREALVAFLCAENPRYLSMGDQYKANIDHYGFPTWYEWRLCHWGTKWDLDETTEVEEGDGWVCYTFHTAWDPPVSICEALRAQFPDLDICWFYDEPGMQVAGYL